MTARQLKNEVAKRCEMFIPVPKRKGRVLAVRQTTRTDEVAILWDGWGKAVLMHRRTAADYAATLRSLAPGQPIKLRPYGYSGNYLRLEHVVEEKGHFMWIGDSQQLGVIVLTLEQARAHAEQVMEVATWLAEQESRDDLEYAP